MPRSYEEIIQEILAKAGRDQMMMEDPSRMQDTMESGIPNNDMLFNPQPYTTMKSPSDYDAMTNPGFMLDKMGPTTQYDDTQTSQNRDRRHSKMVDDAYGKTKTPVVDPDYVSPPPRPNTGPMGQAYNQMPMTEPPISNMPQQMPQQPTDQQMQQLMDFYTGGGGVEL